MNLDRFFREVSGMAFMMVSEGWSRQYFTTCHTEWKGGAAT